MDAGLVRALPNPAEGNDRTVYRLNADSFRVAVFQAALALAVDAGAAAAARDPLVAAPCGAPRPARGGTRGPCRTKSATIRIHPPRAVRSAGRALFFQPSSRCRRLRSRQWPLRLDRAGHHKIRLERSNRTAYL